MINRRKSFLSFVIFLKEDFKDLDSFAICLKSLVSVSYDLSERLNIIIFSFNTNLKLINDFLATNFKPKQRKKIFLYCVDQKILINKKFADFVVKKIDLFNPEYLKIIDPSDWLHVSNFNNLINRVKVLSVDFIFHNYTRIVNSSFCNIELNEYFRKLPHVNYLTPRIPVRFICWETIIFKYSVFKTHRKLLEWVDNIFLNYQLSLWVFLVSKSFFFINQNLVYHFPQKRLINLSDSNIHFFSIFINKLLKTNLLAFDKTRKIIFANYLKQILFIFLKNLNIFKKTFSRHDDFLKYKKSLIKDFKLLDRVVYNRIYKNILIKIFIWTSGKVNLIYIF